MPATDTSATPAPTSINTSETIPSDETGVAPVNHALAILDAFTEEAPILTLAQLSQKTGLYKSTILHLLQAAGERDPETAAIACPVFGAGNRLEGAVTLSGPLTRFGESETLAMVAPLIAAARKPTVGFMGNARLLAVADTD